MSCQSVPHGTDIFDHIDSTFVGILPHQYTSTNLCIWNLRRIKYMAIAQDIKDVIPWFFSYVSANLGLFIQQ